MIEIVRLSEKDATYYWNAIEALVEKGLNKTDREYSVEDYKEYIECGYWELWIVIDTVTAEIKGLGVTELIEYPNFSELLVRLVEGGDVRSDGMSDDVMFKVMKEENDDPDYALLSPDEYVLDAHTVAALGNGSTDSGTDRLDNFVANIRQKAYTKGEQPKELNGLRELASLMG